MNNDLMYVPLQFWFNRNPALALPMVALQYHQININFNFKDINNILTGKLNQPTNFTEIEKD